MIDSPELHGPPTWVEHLNSQVAHTHDLLQQAEQCLHTARLNWRWSKIIHKVLVRLFLGTRSIRRHLYLTRGIVNYWRWLSEVEYHRQQEQLSRIIDLNATLHRTEDGDSSEEETPETFYPDPTHLSGSQRPPRQVPRGALD